MESSNQFTNGYALLIGVDEYVNAPELNLPVARLEATTIAEVLTSADAAGYPPDQVVLLTGKSATHKAVLDALHKLQEVTVDDSIVLILLCGHGVLRDDDDEYFFLMSDTVLTRPVKGGMNPPPDEISLTVTNALSGAEFVRALSSIGARIIVLFNTGLTSSSETYHPPPPVELIDILLSTGKDRVIISACAPDEQSYFYLPDSSSIFGQAIINVIKGNYKNTYGDNVILAAEFYGFLSDQVREDTGRLGLKQGPIQATQGDDLFPIGLYRGGRGATSQTSQTSPVEAAGPEQKPPDDESYEGIRGGIAGESEGAKIEDTGTPIISPPTVVRRGGWLALYNADSASADPGRQKPLDDLLDITPDVRAFATLIASKRLVPPLSIGLFGEWGSGKSFFMQLLREEVKKRAEAAGKTGLPQSQLMFYKHIRQIEFNAWQYMEGDLWASLVSHIFDELINIDRANVADEVRKERLEGLGVQKAAAEAAQAREEEAKIALSAAEAEMVKAQDELRAAETRVLAITPRNILATALNQTPVVNALKELRKVLGLDDEWTGDVEKAYDETQAVLQRSRSLFGSLLGGGNRIWWLLLIPVISIVAGFLAAIVTTAIGSEGFAQTAALITSIGGLIAGAVAWLRTQLGWVSGWLANVEKAKVSLEASIQERTKDERDDLAKREADAEAARKRLSEAQEARAKAQQQVAQAEEELKNASPQRLLASFLEQRVQSTDYRQHLGILALIRQDFKTLSDLMSAGNRDLEAMTDMEKEKEGETVRINRIVLYIDDLDRCPPENVVKVLQAVNLLLGLPLFVVVVAVDARWVRGSLLSRYTGLLQDDRALAPGNGLTNSQEMRASPLDYLEKIFQIPFWLSPISQDGRVKMLKDLLKPGPTPARTGESSRVDTQGQILAPKEPDGGTAGTVTPVTPTSPVPDTRETVVEAGQVGPGAAEDGAKAREVAHSQPDEVNMNPEAMTVQQSELDFIEDLSPLLGRSPRALKRFVNTYMLIKARLGDAGILLGEAEDKEFKVILLLLALVTHSPEIAPLVFQAIDHQATATSANTKLWESIRAYVEENATQQMTYPDWEAEWKRIAGWLDKHQAELEIDWKRLNEWVQRIARYAYVADPRWLS